METESGFWSNWFQKQNWNLLGSKKQEEEPLPNIRLWQQCAFFCCHRNQTSDEQQQLAYKFKKILVLNLRGSGKLWLVTRLSNTLKDESEGCSLYVMGCCVSVRVSTVHLYLWRKHSFLVFCFVVMRSIEPGCCFRLCSWCLSKALHSTTRSAWALVTWCFLDLLCKSSWILKEMISSLTIKKLNHSWNFQRNWNVPLVLLERSWWAKFNGIFFG